MKLITKAIANKLHKADQQVIAANFGGGAEYPDDIVVKFFAPWGSATWFIMSGTPLDERGEPIENPDDAKDWHLFGFCDLGDKDMAELGYVLLSQLQEIEGPFRLKIERDRNYTGKIIDGKPEGY